MAFGVSANRVSRGPSPGFRFALYAIMSITLMFMDRRDHYLDDVRFMLQAATYPIQVAVSSPSSALHWMQDLFESRDALRAENARLLTRQRELAVRSARYDALARENAELRGLREALPPVADKWLVAEVMNVDPNPLRQAVLLNRGTQNGVFKAQAVLDDMGLLGQTTHVGPWSAEVILITDPEHAVPIELARTGVRTIAVGTGTGLALPYLPGNADVKVGDLLITSGLGGVFPQGYPVARVSAVARDSVQPLAQVRAAPLARIERAREVMLVWFREAHPAAPGTTSGADLKTGDATAQPQVAPPKPKPAPTEPPAADAAKPGTPAPAGVASGASASKPATTPAAGTGGTKPATTTTTAAGTSGAKPATTPAPSTTTPAAKPSAPSATPSATPPAAPAKPGTSAPEKDTPPAPKPQARTPSPGASR